MKRRIFHFFSWFVLIMLSSCAKEPQKKYVHLQGNVFGTFYNIKFDTTDVTSISTNDLDSIFAMINRSLSTFDSSSVISRINQNDSSVVLDSLFQIVFEAGQTISSQTDGAFDMTVAPLVNCWGFGFKKKDSVTDGHVDSLMKLVGYEKVSVVDGRVKKRDPAIMLDASAIAKGFSCDCVANYLISRGCSNFLIDIGGEIVSKGVNEKNGKWTIGITRPLEGNAIDRPDLQEIVQMSECAMATSGNYRQFYYKDGKRFSHTIDPKTGYPVDHNLLSATVVMSDCMSADAFATAFMVMGLESAYEIASSHPDMAAYFIYEDENRQLQVKYTDSFKKYFLEK